jgi:molybdate transport system ATP-binding protein
MPPFPLAAIRFDDQPVDLLLSEFAARLTRMGVRVGGVVQGRAQGAAGCTDLELRSLDGVRRFPLSQRLGPGSQACRLDPGALADCGQMLLEALNGDLDLLVLNRFGKAEDSGHGFRAVIATAIERDIPVLTAVRGRNVEMWARFTAATATLLPPEPAALMDWFSGLARPRPAHPGN